MASALVANPNPAAQFDQSAIESLADRTGGIAVNFEVITNPDASNGPA